MQLKDEHRDLALANMFEDDGDLLADALSEALYFGCRWHESPQGEDFWGEIYEQIKDGTYFDAPQHTPEDFEAKAKEHVHGTKDTNPKDGVGAKKVPMSGMPIPVLMECGLVKLHGDLKYGRYNWREAGVRASVYYDAALRHLAAYWEGEDIDPDSGIHHISHVITGLSVLRDSQLQGNCNDDRPKPYKSGWVSEMNEIASNMIEKHNNDK